MATKAAAALRVAEKAAAKKVDEQAEAAAEAAEAAEVAEVANATSTPSNPPTLLLSTDTSAVTAQLAWLRRMEDTLEEAEESPPANDRTAGGAQAPLVPAQAPQAESPAAAPAAAAAPAVVEAIAARMNGPAQTAPPVATSYESAAEVSASSPAPAKPRASAPAAMAAVVATAAALPGRGKRETIFRNLSPER